MSILNVDKIQPIGGGSTITVDATDIQASTGTIRASTFSGDVSATGIGVTSLNVTGVSTFAGTVNTAAISASGNLTITNTEPSLFLTDTNANPDYKLFNDQGVFKIYDTTYSATRLQVATNGEVTIQSNTNFPNGITMNPGTASVVNTIAQRLGNTTAKIRFPANDTFTVETLGSERLRIASNGTIGINSTSPGALLDLSSSQPGILFSETGVSANNGKWLNQANASELYWQAQTDAHSGGGNLFKMTRSNEQIQTFEAQQSGVSWFTIRNSDKRVGINQASPRTSLDVNGYVFLGNGNQIQITGSSGAKGLQLIGQDDGTSLIGTMGSSGEHLLFRTGSSERMRLLVGGPHLLLGGTSSVNEITETSSSSGLVIGNTSMGNGGLAIINSTTGTGRIYFGDSVGGNAERNRGQINYYHNGDYMLFATAGSERLRIDSNGNVTKPTSFHLVVDRSSNQTGYNACNMSDVIIWNRVQTGQSSTGAASHFDTSTGLFTAPVTGLYLFHVAVNCSYAVQGAWLNINGSRPNFANFYPNGANSADAMITYKVTAGQTVGVKWYYNCITNGTINSNPLHTWWRIVLLG